VTTKPVPLERAQLHGNEVIQTPIGDIELVDTYFDDDASRRLFDELDYQRAVQCYIWSHPLVSVTTWRDREAKAYGVTGETDFVVLRSLKEKRGIVTANLTTPYIFNFISLKPGAARSAALRDTGAKRTHGRHRAGSRCSPYDCASAQTREPRRTACPSAGITAYHRS
jgi:hypothetical protein